MESTAGSAAGLSAGRSGSGSKRIKEATELAQRLSLAQQGVTSKEAELTELRTQLNELERNMAQLCRETGARSQRVNVNTLTGTPNVKQVGVEMAGAIRRRQQRRKEMLRDKVNKLTSKLGSKMAINRELKREIDNRRLARQHHLAAVRIGGAEVEKSQHEVAELIVASQRAYAEKETILLKLADLKRRANEESKNLDEAVEQCDVAMEELDEECRQRDISVEDARAEVGKALELAKQAEEEHEVEVERFAAVRNTRLELQNALDGVYETLHVASFAELVDAYRTTGSKVLSLWGKQGEQEDEVDALEKEIKQVTKETESAQTVLNKWRTLAIARQATSVATVSAEQQLEKQVQEREAVLQVMCASLTTAFESIPLLEAQLPTGATSKVTAHTLLQYLGLVEALVVRLVGTRVAAAAKTAAAVPDDAELVAEAEAEAAAAEMAAAEERAIAEAAAAQEGSKPAANAPAAEAEAPSVEAPGARRGRVGVQPPTIEGGPALLTSGYKEEPQPTGMEKLKYGRASLRSELMDQIRSGVHMQMDRLVEEERAVASLHGGKPNAEAAEALKGRSGRSGASAPAINRAQRERSIDEWLARRKSGPPQHGPSTDSLALVEPSSAARRGYAKGGAVVGGHGSSQSGSRSAPPELRSNRSAPSIFASAGGREIFDHVTRISADRASSKAFAAETLPKLPALPELPSLTGGGASGYGGGYGGDMAGYGEDMASDVYATDPRHEIEEIERRLALLEQERLQIHELKHMAVAAGNLSSTQAPPPPPQMGGGSSSHGRVGLGSSSSMGSMPVLGPLGGAVRAQLGPARSTSSVSLQPIGRQRVRS